MCLFLLIPSLLGRQISRPVHLGFFKVSFIFSKVGFGLPVNYLWLFGLKTAQTGDLAWDQVSYEPQNHEPHFDHRAQLCLQVSKSYSRTVGQGKLESDEA